MFDNAKHAVFGWIRRGHVGRVSGIDGLHITHKHTTQTPPFLSSPVNRESLLTCSHSPERLPRKQSPFCVVNLTTTRQTLCFQCAAFHKKFDFDIFCLFLFLPHHKNSKFWFRFVVGPSAPHKINSLVGRTDCSFVVAHVSLCLFGYGLGRPSERRPSHPIHQARVTDLLTTSSPTNGRRKSRGPLLKPRATV